MSTYRERLASTWGVRLLFEPRFQMLALSVLAVIVVGFRIVQFAVLSQAPQFGYDVASYWQAARHLLDGAPLYAPEQLSGPYPDTGNHIYLYPPLLAVLFIPFAAAFPTSYLPVAWIWAAIGVILLTAVVRWVATAEGIVDRPSWPAADPRRGLRIPADHRRAGHRQHPHRIAGAVRHHLVGGPAGRRPGCCAGRPGDRGGRPAQDRAGAGRRSGSSPLADGERRCGA